MPPDPVQLSDYGPSKNGIRYAEADREAAYMMWFTMPARSLRKVADDLSISTSTVTGWSKAGKWTERARKDDAEQRRSVRAALARRLLVLGERGVDEAEAILGDRSAPPHVRLDAAKWLAGLAGLVPVQRSEATILRADEEPEARPRYTLDQLAGMSPDELAALQAGQPLPTDGDQTGDDRADDGQADDPEAGLA